jgi:hypothetical protein
MSKNKFVFYGKGYGLKSREIPSFAHLLELQPIQDRTEIARNLGLSLRTLQRYEVDNHAPRAVMLALFHESSHGIELRHVQLFNEARAYAQLANSLQRLHDAQCVIDSALHFRSGLAANSPVFCCQLELFEPLPAGVCA